MARKSRRNGGKNFGSDKTQVEHTGERFVERGQNRGNGTEKAAETGGGRRVRRLKEEAATSEQQ